MRVPALPRHTTLRTGRPPYPLLTREMVVLPGPLNPRKYSTGRRFVRTLGSPVTVAKLEARIASIIEA